MIRVLVHSLMVLIVAVGAGNADQQDPRLEDLFEALQDSRDPATLQRLEADIWDIWLDSGRDDVNQLMSEGIAAMRLDDLDTALAKFQRITDLAPEFAEGWNKRATVYYLRDELESSVRDIQRTLALEPRHFGALSGMGLIFMKLGDTTGAIQAFRGVMEVHPHSPSAQAHIEFLTEQLKDDLI